MGFYINADSKGKPLPTLGKAEALVADGAKELARADLEFQPNLVCVVSNGTFEAVGYCYNMQEYLAFLRPDGRPRRWLVYEHASRLSGYDKYEASRF